MITPNSGIASFLAPDRNKLTVPAPSLPAWNAAPVIKSSFSRGLDVTMVA
jgi:hypothetical protein